MKLLFKNLGFVSDEENSSALDKVGDVNKKGPLLAFEVL